MANKSVEKIDGLKEPFFLQKQYKNINCDTQFYHTVAQLKCAFVSVTQNFNAWLSTVFMT